MAKCVAKRVTIRKTHGRKLAKPITFTSHRGPGCGKPKRKTGHLTAFKAAFKEGAKACSKKYDYFTKPYGKCVANAVKGVKASNR